MTTDQGLAELGILVEILGDRGRHTRAAVAVTGLPKDTTVEIQAIFEVA